MLKPDDKRTLVILIVCCIIVMCGIFWQQANAHELTPAECPFYSGAARAIVQARNADKPVTEVVPEVMKALSECSADGSCPVKDGQDTKRVLDFVRETYSLVIPAGKEIDVDATTAKIEEECERAATKRPGDTMKPDPKVPSTGKQVES